MSPQASVRKRRIALEMLAQIVGVFDEFFVVRFLGEGVHTLDGVGVLLNRRSGQVWLKLVLFLKEQCFITLAYERLLAGLLERFDGIVVAVRLVVVGAFRLPAAAD